MILDTLTLTLEGDVNPQQFGQALLLLQRLVMALGDEVVGDSPIDWLIDDLQAGSAAATIMGKSPHPESVARVVEAYEKVGYALQRAEPIPFSAPVKREVSNIIHLAKDNITGIRFETARMEATIYGEFDVEAAQRPIPTTSFGAVKGRVETTTIRGKVKFNLYDLIFDKPITCFLREDQKDVLHQLLGQTVIVAGRVTRDPENGRALRVRDIRSIDPVRTGDYRQARGVLAWEDWLEPAEVSIRRLRDGEDELSLP